MHHALLGLVRALGSIAAGSRSYEYRDKHGENPPKPATMMGGACGRGELFRE